MINLMLYAILKIKNGVNYQEVKKKSNEGDFFFIFFFCVGEGFNSKCQDEAKQESKESRVRLVSRKVHVRE